MRCSAAICTNTKEEEIAMKEYLTPQMEIVEIETADIVTASTNTFTGETNVTTTTNYAPTSSTTGFFDKWKTPGT